MANPPSKPIYHNKNNIKNNQKNYIKRNNQNSHTKNTNNGQDAIDNHTMEYDTAASIDHFNTNIDYNAATTINHPPVVEKGVRKSRTQKVIEKPVASTPRPKRISPSAQQDIRNHTQPQKESIQEGSISNPFYQTIFSQYPTQSISQDTNADDVMVEALPLKKKRTSKPLHIKYDISNDILNQKANINVGELITISAPLRRQLLTACKQSKVKKSSESNDHAESINDKEKQSTVAMNSIDNSEVVTTAAYTDISVNGIKVTGLIDCGAARACMSRSMMKLLELDIDAPSASVFVLGNDTKQSSLGIIHDVPITVGNGLTIPIDVEVLPKCPEHIILGTSWLDHAQAVINFNNATLRITYKRRSQEVPITYIKSNDRPFSYKRVIQQQFESSLPQPNMTPVTSTNNDNTDESDVEDTDDEDTDEEDTDDIDTDEESNDDDDNEEDLFLVDDAEDESEIQEATVNEESCITNLSKICEVDAMNDIQKVTLEPYNKADLSESILTKLDKVQLEDDTKSKIKIGDIPDEKKDKFYTLIHQDIIDWNNNKMEKIKLSKHETIVKRNTLPNKTQSLSFGKRFIDKNKKLPKHHYWSKLC